MNNTMTFLTRRTIYLLSFIFLSSCVNSIDDEDAGQTGGTEDKSKYPVVLAAKVHPTSVRINGTDFEENDAIGLFMLNQPNKLNEKRHANNVKFTYSENEGFQSAKTIFFTDENTLTDFISYYPYKKNAIKSGEAAIEVAVATDQTETTVYNQSDFLVAVSKNIEASNDAVELVFKHKLSRLDIKLVPNTNYTAEELEQLQPTIKIKDVYTKALYDFENKTFNSLNTIKDVIPYGTWKLENGTLCGKSLLILPQTLTPNHSLLEIRVGDKIYTHQLDKELIFESGNPHEMSFSLEKGTSEARCILTARIEEWGEVTKQNTIANEVSTFINIDKINFGTSNIYKVINKEEQVAEITKEYLLSADKKNKAQAIIIYPIKEAKADLENGIILKVLLHEEKEVHGGTIKWNLSENSFTLGSGNSGPINIVYITKDKEITFARPEGALQVQLKADVLIDTRGNETITYPLVKIGTQYWMRSNLKATKYTNGENITKSNDFSDNTAKYSTFQNNYFYYSAAVIATGSVVPQNWRISNHADWGKLMNYIQDDTTVLRGGKWEETDGISSTNSSGFNAVATGFFKEGKANERGKYVYYWRTVDDPQSAVGSAVVLYNENIIRYGTVTQGVGYCIRCLRND